MPCPSDSEDETSTGSPKDRAAASAPSTGHNIQTGDSNVAKTTPLEFIRQVQAETKKVVWPSRKETVMTAVMVMIMTTILAIFFFGIDKMFDGIVKLLLSLATKG